MGNCMSADQFPIEVKFLVFLDLSHCSCRTYGGFIYLFAFPLYAKTVTFTPPQTPIFIAVAVS